MDNTYLLQSSSKKKEKRNIVLDGSTMEYEKRTITSFVKYRRRENGQYLHTAFIIEEKGKKKHRVRRFNHGIRKKNHHFIREISSSGERTILTAVLPEIVQLVNVVCPPLI